MTINRLEELIVTAIKIEDKDIKKALEEERPLDDLKGLLVYVAKCFDDYKKGND